jgi:insertion element IS1 protein InsB
MSIALPPCPTCQSTHTVKNGNIHNGKQNFKCRECGKQFVQDPQKKSIDQTTNTVIDTLVLEKVPLAGIPRVVGVFRALAAKLR